MRPIRWGVGGILLAGALAHPTGAQSCPYALQMAGYGPGCGLTPLVAARTSAASACAVTFTLSVPPPSSTCSISIPFLVLGLQPAAIPMQGGCALLAYPDLVLGMTLDPSFTSGSLSFGFAPAPALIGLTVYTQGVAFRICNPGGGLFSTSEGLQVVVV